MKHLLGSVGRFGIIGLASFCATTVTNWANHQGYWNGTILRVQTTDFNILKHTLPTKLSLALIENNTEEVQRTLDSNYGLFGMVVTNCITLETNCPGQQMLYSTNSNREWKQQLTVEKLAEAPYSILRNPPPVVTETEMMSNRQSTWLTTGRINSGEIIGRVYYVRGISPEFWTEYPKWINRLPGSLLSDSGAQKYYSLALGLFGFAGLAAFIYIERIHKQKRIQKRQLLDQLEQSRLQGKEQLSQISCLIAEKEQFVEKLKADLQQESQASKQIIEYLENQLAQNHKDEALRKTYSVLQEENQKNQQTIETLQQQIQQSQNQQNNDLVNKLKQELEAIKRRNTIIEEQSQNYKHQVEDLQSETEQQTTFLKTQAEKLKQRERQANLKLQEAEQTINQLKAKECRDAEDIRLLEEQIATLRQEEELNDFLNEFERTIQKCLEGSRRYQARQWRLRSQFDVGQGRRSRQLTDFIVIGQSCVFIVEVKYYVGKILAEGDVRNTQWTCRTPAGRDLSVRGASRENPYMQVVGYTDSMMDRVQLSRAGGRIGVYGIIVFPEGADISYIQPEIGGYYRVTTLERLVQVIQDLELAFAERNRHRLSSLSVEQLNDLICGRPVRRQPPYFGNQEAS
ncbi:NERD domain-containing protein [Cyanobacteria bacterium FACHB-DQ100]|nr:NERD domain-containing protein [Cyanobacteria bacterium FACHB-DQ100]